MVSWLKRFALSFFSDVQAEESVRGGFGVILLTSFLSIIFTFFGVFAGKYVPFFSDYKSADGFREFIYATFIGDGGEPEISISVSDGRAQITQRGGNRTVNTVKNEDDSELYSLNGYALIVDARNVSSTYDDFTAYCVRKSDGAEISYEDYRELSAGEQTNYSFAVRYSGVEKVISAEDAAHYREYLATEDVAKDSLKNIEDGKQNVSEQEYYNALYELYVKIYYPLIYSYAGENVPTLRNYYYLCAARANDKFLCLFGDMMVVSFKSGTGKTVYYGCAYEKSGGLFEDGISGNARGEVDAFIKDTYYGNLSLMLLMELLNSIVIIIITEFIIVAFMLACWQICRLKKIGISNTFAKSAKLIGSFSHVAALISAVLTFCAGFLFGSTGVVVTLAVTFVLALGIRLTVFLINQKRKNDRTPSADTEKAV